MAQDCLRAGIQESGPETALQREGGVPQGIHVAMNPEETAGLQPPRDHGPAQTVLAQLPAADNAMLSLNERQQYFCVKFCPTVGRNLTQIGHGPMVAAEMCRNARERHPSLPKLCRVRVGIPRRPD
jgi:hypothetical protein